MTQGHTSDPENRVVDIRTNKRFQRAHGGEAVPVAPIDHYAHKGNDSDDFRHRMIANVLAFVFVAALIAAAIWLADSILTMRKNQDCGLQGRKNCAPIDAPLSSR